VGIELGMKIFPNAAIYANLGKASDQARDASDTMAGHWGKP